MNNELTKKASLRVTNLTGSSNSVESTLGSMAAKALFIMEDRLAVAQVERSKMIGTSQAEAEKALTEALRHEAIAYGIAKAILVMTEDGPYLSKLKGL